MNWDQLAKSIGQLVRLQPPAKRIRGSVVLSQSDEFWRIRDVKKRKTVEIININTPHIAKLGSDYIVENLIDQAINQFGEKCNIFKLKVQVILDLDSDLFKYEPL